MEEYNIWHKIFNEEDDIVIEKLIELVVTDDDARDLVFDNIMKLKNIPNKMFKFNINIDKSLMNVPPEVIAKQVATDIIENLENNQ